MPEYDTGHEYTDEELEALDLAPFDYAIATITRALNDAYEAWPSKLTDDEYGRLLRIYDVVKEETQP